MPKPLLLLLTLQYFSLAVSHNHHNRHLLHQPFFPILLPPTQAPSYSPQPQQHKLPFSSSSSTPPETEKPFFPFYQSSSPPPSPSSLSSFPANISSLLLPAHISPSHRHVLAIVVSASLISAAIILASAAFFFYHRRQRKLHSNIDDKASISDGLCLYPPNTATSDGPPKLSGTPSTSTEFLYFGTLVNSSVVEQEKVANSTSRTGLKIGVSGSPYQKLGSPELRPLPPLPKHNVKQSYKNFEGGLDGDEEGDEFYSPRESAESPGPIESSSPIAFKSIGVDNFGSRSFTSRTTSHPCSKSPSPTTSVSNTSSPPLNLSPRNLVSKSTVSVINFRAPFRPSPIAILPSPTLSTSSSLSERGSGNAQNSPARNSNASGPRNKSQSTNESNVKPFVPAKLPPPPPPVPPARFWEIPVTQSPNLGTPVLVTPSSKPTGFLQAENNEVKDETLKPKLKPLHWDKVKASSDRATVWDQLKSSSFQLNEEMIETLFTVNNLNLTAKDNGHSQVPSSFNQENQILDPKKSQNIAILLKALNVTIDEVCEALVEGNSDSLGTELLESLLKMAPTKEEEQKLKDFKDESPSKLGPAEMFLKAVIDIPFAFKRVDALLYVANFDSEVEYLKRSFNTLEEACEELKNSRMFLKLLEAVLKTGNRMNVGTNRGDARAFKLDTLLKLVDVKGTDGKTTLLHFVLQEIIRAEGYRLSGLNTETTETSEQSSFQNDIKHRKLGLQVVSGLSEELSNVKKAAAMDSDVLSKEVAKLAEGIAKIAQVVKLNEEIALKDSSRKFSEAMKEFLKKAGEEIVRLQEQEKLAFSLVKEITEYFHGNSAKEEAHPFRIFMVVRDFFSILDRVCKEVGKVNERSEAGFARQFPLTTTSPTLPPVFPGLNGEQHYGSSDEDTSSSF